MSFLPRRLLIPTRTRAAICAAALGLFAFAPTLHAAVGDADDDGVADATDLFPCRSDATSAVFVPAENSFASLYFEDQWPSQGDYDFNDLVLDHNAEIYQLGGNVKSIRLTYHPRAYGAAFDNGVAVHLPITTAAAGTVQITRKVGAGAATTVSPIAGETDLVINIASNIRSELFGGAAGQINTVDANSTVTGQAVEIVVTFTTPVSLNAALAPFDVFLYRTNEYSHQIHRPQFAGTAQMRPDLFGTLDDGSNASKKFVDKRGVPFVLEIPTTANITKENIRIDALFPDIVGFGQSGGATNQNFFNNNVNATRAFSRTLPVAPNVAQLTGFRDTSCINVTSVPTDNLLLYWPLDAATASQADASGNGNTGTAANISTAPTAIIGNGLQFNGTTGKVSAPSSLLPTGDLTLAAWVKRDSTNTVDYIMGNYGLSCPGGIEFALANTDLTFYNNNGYNIATVSLPAGEFHHVAAVRKNGIVSIFLDGVQQTLRLTTANNVVNSSSCKFTVGNGPDYTNEAFGGVIDDARVYGRALSTAEVAVLARRTNTNPEEVAPDKLVGYWPLNETSGSTTTDASGNNQTGTLSGGVVRGSAVKFGNAMTFDGGDDKITMPSAVLTGTTDFTLSAWINRTSNTGADYIMGNYGASPCGNGIEFYTHNGGLIVYLGNTYVTTSASLQINRVYHVAATRKNGVVTVYVDGVVVFTQNAADSIGGNCAWGIGNGPNYTSEAFGGKIDDARVYTRALNATEISALADINRPVGLVRSNAAASCQALFDLGLSTSAPYFINENGQSTLSYCDMSLKQVLCSEIEKDRTGRTKDTSALNYSMRSILRPSTGICEMWAIRNTADSFPIDALRGGSVGISTCAALGFIKDSTLRSCAFGAGNPGLFCGYPISTFFRYGDACSGCSLNNGVFNRYVLQGSMSTAGILSDFSGSIRSECATR